MEKDDELDHGIPVGKLSDSDLVTVIKKRLAALEHPETNKIILNISPWAPTSNIVSVDRSILALVVKSSDQNSVVRTLCKPARVIKTDHLPEEILIALGPTEGGALILGKHSVRYVRSGKA